MDTRYIYLNFFAHVKILLHKLMLKDIFKINKDESCNFEENNFLLYCNSKLLQNFNNIYMNSCVSSCFTKNTVFWSQFITGNKLCWSHVTANKRPKEIDRVLLPMVDPYKSGLLCFCKFRWRWPIWMPVQMIDKLRKKINMSRKSHCKKKCSHKCRW